MARIRTPLGPLPWWAVVTGNAVFWPSWTFACGYLMHRWPGRAFDNDSMVTRARSFEAGGRFYEDRLRIKRWKDRLPEAGGLFEGGFVKRDVGSGDPDVMQRFVAETRRAEAMHWLVVSGIVVPALWNPWWALPVNAGVAAGSNLPCIAIQRYNRARLQRVLGRLDRSRRRASSSVSA